MKRTPKRRKTKKSSRRTYADTLFSNLVRSLGFCENCGSSDRLEAAHIVPRRFLSVRWERGNAVCICHTCHSFYTTNPYSWDDWVTERIGAEAYRDLKRRAEEGRGPPDYDRVIEDLKAARKEAAS